MSNSPLAGSAAARLAGQGLPSGNVALGGLCRMAMNSRSFGLTALQGGEIVVVKGRVKQIERLEGSFDAALPRD
ncbi:MAG TPA: hypothetical protein VK557_08495 [Pyrinomonadaceae bacterium]|nr:hypothetical protein [Pyrinomonadaceae bacterium]